MGKAVMNDFERLSRVVVDELGEPPPALLEEQRQRLLRRARPPRPVLGHSRPLLLAAAMVGVLALGGAAVLKWRSVGPVALPANPSATRASAEQQELWLEGSPHARPVSLDGEARVMLSSSARARLQRMSAAERRVTIESGRLQVDIDPKTTKRWSFLAGAYRIDVLATAFSVDYDPDSGGLEIVVTRGRVRVSGGKLSPEGITLRAGQRFAASGNTVQVVTSEAQTEPESHKSQSAAAGTGHASSVSRSAEPDDWRVLYRAGDYAAALAAAERTGFDALVHSADAPDLSNLADAARLSGSSGRARQALQALRSRFAGSPAAAKAAFLLGRMEGSPRWFETYLREQPAGPYAPEAAGRLVVAYRDHGDLGRARAAAQQYLARYPGGAYAELARSLLARQ
jgi:ferric-dicitrate binding protein FerR (iron transport regulator)